MGKGDDNLAAVGDPYIAVSARNTLRLRRVRKEKISLERTVIARTDSLETALQDLENAKQEVDHQVAAMSRMLASMTHDVQSPLNYITLVSAEITYRYGPRRGIW